MDAERPISPRDVEREALTQIIDALSGVESENRPKILRAATVFFGIDASVSDGRPVIDLPRQSNSGNFDFSADRALSPKDFLADKQPETDVERAACLAYYLTHFRDTPHFRTADISKLNTEAAQIKFSNAANAVSNAVRSGLLTGAAKGLKQITAAGEAYVLALPDRLAAKSTIARKRARNRKRTLKKKG